MKLTKKIILTMVVIVGIILISWRVDRTFFHPFIPGFSLQIQNDITTTKFSIPKNQADCELVGGVWDKMGTRPIEECNLMTTDSGKSCSASKMCEGVCLADLSREELRAGMGGKMIRTEGKCSARVKQVGCLGMVYRGWSQVVCID